jgi:hypothetical protein
MTLTYFSASSPCRAFAARHSSSSTMRNSGTSPRVVVKRRIRAAKISAERGDAENARLLEVTVSQLAPDDKDDGERGYCG